jgi:protein phosphatase
MQFRVHTCSKIGRRDNQEDRACQVAYRDGVIVAVADGMGGHRAGEVASSLAVRAIQQNAGTLQFRFEQAQKDVVAAGRLPEQRGCGTTLTAAALLQNPPMLGWAHIGDSRINVIRDGKLTRLTNDHSIRGKMLADGLMTEDAFEAGKGHPGILCYTGMNLNKGEILPIETGTLPLKSGDVVVLTTDGVHDVLTRAAFLSLVLAGGRSSTTIATGLVDAALAAGGSDNATAVAVVVE